MFEALGKRDLVIQGNSMEVAKNAPAEAVQLVYIDPPFATGGKRVGKQGMSFEDPGYDPVTFTSWLRPLVESTHRVLKDTGSLIVHLDYRTIHYVKVMLDEVFGYENFINEIVWCYSTGGKSSRRFGRKHDTLLWYGKSSRYVFNGDEVRIPRKGGSHMKVERTAEGELVQVKKDAKTGKVYRYPVASGKVPEDWWGDIPTLNRSAKERVGWPTQKPEALLERIIKAASNEGDVVVDWFCGSGTTAYVARRCGRKFLTVDKSDAAIATATARLAAEKEESKEIVPPIVLSAN